MGVPAGPTLRIPNRIRPYMKIYSNNMLTLNNHSGGGLCRAIL